MNRRFLKWVASLGNITGNIQGEVGRMAHLLSCSLRFIPSM